MSESFKTECTEIDALIRKAQGEKAREQISRLFAKKVPLGGEVALSQLARRAYLPELGAKLLHPIVRPTSRLKRKTTDEDRVEYAACLVRIGALKEAEEILKELESAEIAEALFFRAAIATSQWKYPEAVPLLRRYIALPGLNSYQRLVGKINLGLCLLYERKLSEAKSLLGQISEEASAQNLTLIYANALRLLGNLEMDRQNWSEATRYFKFAENQLKDSPSTDLYFCKKWNAIAEYMQNPGSQKAVKQLAQVRAEAGEIRHWESQRDIDYYQAKAEKNNSLFERLYFGSPLQGFRQRLLNGWQPSNELTEYAWHIGEGETTPAVIDISAGQETKGGDYLKVGQSMHRLYRTLCYDFYRPFSVPSLFEKVFPGDHYAPGASELRVHQALQRLRAWFKKNSLPLSIAEAAGEYSLIALKPCSIIVRLGNEAKSSYTLRLELIKVKIGSEFTLKDVATLFKITRRGASVFIQEALAEGTVTKTGAGVNTKYIFEEHDQLIKKAS